jgi:hypothetical protein
MFQSQEIFDAVKSLAANDPINGFSHCQILEIKVRQLGFQSFHHMRETLKHLSPSVFSTVSISLMRKICEKRLPTLDCAYFEFMMLPKQGVGFYSKWAGWDRHGDEVRVPRPLDGVPTAQGLRKLADYPIYVLESSKEITAWRYNWKATALIPDSLARETFPLSFSKYLMVDKNPPMDLVRKKSRQTYENNIATD